MDVPVDGGLVAGLIGEQLGFDAMAWASCLTVRLVNFWPDYNFRRMVRFEDTIFLLGVRDGLQF